MKVIVIGANGMLGHDLVDACREEGGEVAGFDLPEVDITKKDGGLAKLQSCDWLVNCAAYTDVDGAESHRETAFAVNGDGAGRVASWCAEHRIPLVHISTDYVFDGLNTKPYKEDDPVRPLSVYGESKLAGERAVVAAARRHIIVRTQSLFGLHGRNFVRSIMGRLESGVALRVVTDQVSAPTYTVHLAKAILRLIDAGQEGIVHVSASGGCSWHEFACAIAARVKPGAEVRKTTSADYKAPARRPANSLLDNSRYELLTGSMMPAWQVGLDEYFREVKMARRGD
jgi:dTDP-4-dehydrorhamnose reductase